MDRLTANLTGRPRRTTLGGREYLVAPLTLIVPGVLNGSQGPGLYPLEEIQRNPAAWNGAPIVLHHPQVNGQDTSARNPQIIEAQGLGAVYNTRANGKLVAEGWFDVENTRRISPDLLQALIAGQPLELSTGLYLDPEPAAPGSVHNDGSPYSFIARNYRPDHLAVFPDTSGTKGACSIKDGCGVNVNEGKRTVFNWFREWLSKTGEGEMNKATLVDELVANCECWTEEDRETLNSLEEDKLQQLIKAAKQAQQARTVANAAKQGFTDPGGNTHVWNEEKDQWETTAAAAAPEGAVGDRENNEEKEKENEEKEKENGNVTAKNQLSEEDWLKNAPTSVREDLEFARNEKQKQKDALIDQLTANIEDESTRRHQRERLARRTLSDLRDDAALLPAQQQQPAPAYNYTGAAAPADGGLALNEEDVLGLPQWDWSKTAD